MNFSTLTARIPIVVALLLCCAISAMAAGAKNGETNAVSEMKSVATNIVHKALTRIASEVDEVSDEYLPSWRAHKVMGIEVGDIAIAFLLVLIGFVLKALSDYGFRKLLVGDEENGPVTLNQVMLRAARKPVGYLIWLVFVSTGIALLLRKQAELWLPATHALTLILAVMGVWFIFRSIDAGAQILAARAQRTRSRMDDALVPNVRRALKFIVGAVVVLWIVSQYYDITALIAGLGIGGLAVALALQDTLANLFGSFFIMLDRPFKIGDRIVVEDVDGTVEQIGFRSTRIRTLAQTQVSIPNKKVSEAVVNNITRTRKWRVSQVVGVTYNTTAEQMEEALEAIRDIIRSDSGIDQEWWLVRFDGFGESSLNISVIYFTKSVDYAQMAAIKEHTNLAIMRCLAERGLSIAFPTRTLYLEGDIARRLAGRGPE